MVHNDIIKERRTYLSHSNMPSTETVGYPFTLYCNLDIFLMYRKKKLFDELMSVN